MTVSPPPLTATLPALLALLLLGAIFGFFYAWICSTMWGLDAIDPRVAIEAMQAMNASVRNAVFFPAFFLTPVACLLAALGIYAAGEKTGALWFAGAGIVYALGGMGLTMVVHVPMNEALAVLEVPASREEAGAIWAEYSPPWQIWNTTRAIFCGIALLMAGLGLMRMAR